MFYVSKKLHNSTMLLQCKGVTVESNSVENRTRLLDPALMGWMRRGTVQWIRPLLLSTHIV